MNTQQKQRILQSFLSETSKFQKNSSSLKNVNVPPQLLAYESPNIELVSQLLQNQKQISKAVDQTYQNCKGVLQELSQLQTRKQNINTLLDVMTAIKQVKRLSYGIANDMNNSHQIYKNISVYYQIKGKVMYCDKYVDKVQQQIKKIKEAFQIQLQQQLKKTNSQNITDIAKTLNLISQNQFKSNISHSHNHIVKFYTQHVRKQLKIYEQDLFKIPIQGNNNTSKSYIFFQIAKDVMKVIVSTITNYKSNIQKIGGQQVLEKTIVQVFSLAMSGIILQIFKRQRKFFDMDPPDRKKVIKQPHKFKEYLNQFCAIWNQIQRLKQHLSIEINSTSVNYKRFINSLQNSVNSQQIINLNSSTYQGLKTYTRYQFNNLLKDSAFVNGTLELNNNLLNKVAQNFIKGIKQQYQCQQAHQFVQKSFQIIMQSMDKTFESLNMLIISPFITFSNSSLIQQDSFHAFTQLFNKIFPRITSVNSDTKIFTAIVLTMNTVWVMPNALRTSVLQLHVPTQLQQYKNTLDNQLKQSVSVCQQKTKNLINTLIFRIVGQNWFMNQLKQDYKKLIDKWKGFTHQIHEIFLTKASQLHSSIILNDQFNLKSPKKIITQQGIIGLQKQVRTIITFYEVKGCSALNSFRVVLQYIEVMLAQSQQTANKLIKKFVISDPQQVQKLALLRAMKVD